MQVVASKKTYRRLWAMWLAAFAYVGILIAVLMIVAAKDLQADSSDLFSPLGLKTLLVMAATLPFYMLVLQAIGFKVRYDVILLNDRRYDVVILRSISLLSPGLAKYKVFVNDDEVKSLAEGWFNPQTVRFELGAERRYTIVARINTREWFDLSLDIHDSLSVS
ncbi:MAG: hypothetical protein HY681_04635 [Chloroflexi bacterium]|nr:hypothetical protein [Chloroflexota bacterium]